MMEQALEEKTEPSSLYLGLLKKVLEDLELEVPEPEVTEVTEVYLGESILEPIWREKYLGDQEIA